MSDRYNPIQIYNDILPKKLCSQWISKFDKDPKVQADPQPDYSTRDFICITEHKSWQGETRQFEKYFGVVTESYFSLPKSYREVGQAEWAHDGIVMSRYSKGDDLALHIDGQSADPPYNGLRIATLVFFLNDVAKGGELVFPFQELKLKPKAGTGIIFPPHLFYPHKVQRCIEQRYIVQAWVIDPRYIVAYR